jgi:hypothetical protein
MLCLYLIGCTAKENKQTYFIESVGFATVDTSLIVSDAVEKGNWDNRRRYGDGGFGFILSGPPLPEFMKNQKDGRIEFFALKFTDDQSRHIDEVLKVGDDHGLRSSEVHETLAFGTENPEYQRTNWTAALNSRWRDPDGCVYCLILGRHGSHRLLRLHWVDDRWHDRWRFLFVRK